MKRYEEMASAYLQERFPTKPNLVESSLKVVQTTPVAIVVTADIVEGMQMPQKIMSLLYVVPLCLCG